MRHNGHADPTMDMAFGSVNKEWKYMASLALQIREGRGNPSWLEEQEKRFTGIFHRLLTENIDELKRQARG